MIEEQETESPSLSEHVNDAMEIAGTIFEGLAVANVPLGTSVLAAGIAFASGASSIHMPLTTAIELITGMYEHAQKQLNIH